MPFNVVCNHFHMRSKTGEGWTIMYRADNVILTLNNDGGNVTPMILKWFGGRKGRVYLFILAFLEVGSCHTWNPRQNPFSLCIYWVRITYIDEILILDPHKCAVGEEHWPTFQNQVCWRKQLTWRTRHLRHTQGVYKGPWHSCSVHRLSKDLKTSKSTSKKCDRLQIAGAQ